jgi:hypothetical protein
MSNTAVDSGLHVCNLQTEVRSEFGVSYITLEFAERRVVLDYLI